MHLLLTILSIPFLLPLILTKEHHIEKAKDAFIVNGVGIKYFSWFKLLSNKLEKQGSKFQSTVPFKSKDNWEMLFKFRFDGLQKGPKDGIGIW